MLLNILWATGACFPLTFNCPIQFSKFFHKTSPVRCPLPGHLIKSVDIEKNSRSTKTSYWSARGQTIIGFLKMTSVISCSTLLAVRITHMIYIKSLTTWRNKFWRRCTLTLSVFRNGLCILIIWEKVFWNFLLVWRRCLGYTNCNLLQVLPAEKAKASLISIPST